MISVVYDKQHIYHSPLTYPSAVGLEEYPEKPTRVESIITALRKQDFCTISPPEDIDLSILQKIHSKKYLAFLQSLETKIPDNAYYYPTEIFHPSNEPHSNFLAELGSFSFDLSAPVDKHIFKQALISASCAYTAAQALHKGTAVAYSLSRPPGHHAMKDKMGGFCYLNNTAIAAEYLSQFDKVVVLDVDYHHGNGIQDIFYDRRDVFTVSLHADPASTYPYYWGSADELGTGDGKGYNLNYPLKHGITPSEYQTTLEDAIKKIKEYAPKYLVVAFGLDTYEKDLLGTFKLTTEYYKKMAQTIRSIDVPAVIIQEGGYYIPNLGKNVVSFMEGMIHI